MKKILSNYRYYVLALLALLAAFGIFAVPAETLPGAYWFYCLISSKIIGFGAWYIAARLTARWEQKGTIVELVNTKNNY